MSAPLEGVSLSEVVRGLVARWVTDEVAVSESDTTRQQTLDKAIASYGMWSDRDPDEFLRQSRINAEERLFGSSASEPRPTLR